MLHNFIWLFLILEIGTRIDYPGSDAASDNESLKSAASIKSTNMGGNGEDGKDEDKDGAAGTTPGGDDASKSADAHKSAADPNKTADAANDDKAKDDDGDDKSDSEDDQVLDEHSEEGK